MRAVTYGGATKTSTVIDASDFFVGGTATDSLTLFGVTGLKAADFGADAIA